MKTILSLFALLPLLLTTPAPAMAADDAIETMAKILLHLNHYPTNDEKIELAAIARNDSATADEKKLAVVLMRMRHRVEGGDADQLKELLKDKAASKDERQLARIMLAIAHHPDAAQKAQLRKLANQ